VFTSSHVQDDTSTHGAARARAHTHTHTHALSLTCARTQDNAWIETSAVHFGCNALLGDMLTLKAVNVKWLDVVLDEEEYKNMYDGHRGWVDDVARSFERAARQLTGNWDATVTHSARKDFFREMHEWTKANVLDGGGGRGSSSIAMYEQVLKSVFINRRDSNGNTALHLAVMKKQTSTVDFLIEHGAAPSLNILNVRACILHVRACVRECACMVRA